MPKKNAIVIQSNKSKGNAHSAQDELNNWMIENLRKNKFVVRLKGGDPFLYGRSAEEIECLHQHGYEVEVIPGLSSALTAPLACGIAVTTRGLADQFLIATAHGKNDRFPKLPPFSTNRTVVFLMSISRLDELCKKLIINNESETKSNDDGEHTYPADTPVKIVENATIRNKQRAIYGTLETISAIAKEENIKNPGVIIVGRVADGMFERSNTLYNNIEWGEGCVRFLNPQRIRDEDLP